MARLLSILVAVVIKRGLLLWLAHRREATRSSLGQFAEFATIVNLVLSHQTARTRSRLMSDLIIVPRYSELQRTQLLSTVIKD